jgi:threonine/homoserine/homoserine lactone efflux protein
LVFVLTCGIFYSAIGLSARVVLRSRPAISRIITRVSGAAMLVIGLLLVERLVLPPHA